MFHFVFKCTGNGLGIRVVGGKDVPGSNGDIGAYVAKVLPGGAAEQTGKILEGRRPVSSFVHSGCSLIFKPEQTSTYK